MITKKITISPLLLDAAQTAILLGISQRYFESLLVGELIPPPVYLGERRLWQRQRIEDFVAKDCKVLTAGYKVTKITEPVKDNKQPEGGD